MNCFRYNRDVFGGFNQDRSRVLLAEIVEI
jgi:hypothetical protein